MANPPLCWLLFYHYKRIEWERKEGHIHDHAIEVQVDCHMKEKVTGKKQTQGPSVTSLRKLEIRKVCLSNWDYGSAPWQEKSDIFEDTGIGV